MSHIFKSNVPGSQAMKIKFYSAPDIMQIPQLAALSDREIRDLRIVSAVLPFRVNNYVVEKLIDWESVPHDPIFRLVFPERAMLDDRSFMDVERVMERGDERDRRRVITLVREKLNPHPADQLTLNRPFVDGEVVCGLQHKYPETVLFFPTDGQTCHSYCTFCFRWPQFIGDRQLRMAMADRDLLARYLAEHDEVTDLLITGGDAFMMKARRLRFFLEPLIQPNLRHVSTIRFGTKALSYWPYRFVSDDDADELLELLEWLMGHGKNVAVMAHYNHWREMSTPIAAEAIRRLQKIGAIIRTQSPILRGINDNVETWSTMWRRQVALGMVPYYMFVTRDTGPKDYFSIPLARAWEVYAKAAQLTSGLARTVRGPSMSTSIGKVEINGIVDLHGERAFVLRFLQSRQPSWCYHPFLAKFDASATWFDELVLLQGVEPFSRKTEMEQSGASA
jgi:KamA family protein